MALRFSYRITAEAMNEPSLQPDQRNVDNHHNPEGSNSGEHCHDRAQARQEAPPSCLDLLTSF